MAQVIRYCDPDASGANDGTSWTDAYESMQEWDNAEATDLVSDGDYHTLYCRSSLGSADGGVLIDTDWGVDATHYIEIISVDDPWSPTAYRIDYSGQGHRFDCRVGCVRVTGLRIPVSPAGANQWSTGLRFSVSAGTIDMRINNCFVYGTNVTQYREQLLYALEVGNGRGGTVKCWNCVAWNAVGLSTVYPGELFRCNGNTTTHYLYNCTGYKSTEYGYRHNTAADVKAYNCTVGDCDSFDFFGAGWNVATDILYCCSDDIASGTGNVQPSGGDWDNEFADKDNGDFTLLLGNCYQAGVDDPGSGLYSDDIRGVARSSPWDIGAYAYGSAAASGNALFMGADF